MCSTNRVLRAQVDAQKLSNAASFGAHDTWSMLLVISVGTAQLYEYLGWSGVVGVGSMVLVLPAQRYCQRNLRKYNDALMKRRDERVSFTNEVLQGMRSLKVRAPPPILMCPVQQLSLIHI